jgi:circadian clock protein KaiB
MTSQALANLPKKHTTRLGPSQLRLYVARGTPNSTRAEQNLRTALNELNGGDLTLTLEVIDVAAHVKLALSDGVIVTPTLIGRGRNEEHTILGDLSNTPKLHLFLGTLRGP